MTIDRSAFRLKRREIKALRYEEPDEAYRQLVALYEAYLASELIDNDLQLVLQEFCTDQVVFKREDAARETVYRMIKVLPDSVLALDYAGFFLAFVAHAYDDAVAMSRKAVAASMKEGDFTIHALNGLCRVARECKRFDVMREAMEQLAETPPKVGMPFQEVETDYLQEMPSGVVPDDLIERLINRAGRSAT